MPHSGKLLFCLVFAACRPVRTQALRGTSIATLHQHALLVCLALGVYGPPPTHARRQEVNVANRLVDSDASKAAAALELPPVYVTWTAVKFAYESYFMFKKGKAVYNSYVQRSEAVRQIAEGNTAHTAALVRAAHQELEEGRSQRVQEALQSNAFLQFKAMLATFQKAHEMCILEEIFFKEPSRWAAQKLQPLTSAEWEALEKGKQVIQSIIDSMQAVIDHGVCPRLAKEIKEDLTTAQEKVEAWEEMTTMRGTLQRVSWYEMQYAAATAGQLSGTALTLKLQEKIQNLRTEVDKVDFDTCYSQPQFQHHRPQPRHVAGIDEYEISFNESEDGHMKELWKFADEAQQAFDRASMNLDQYERDCQGVEPKGKDGLINEISASADSGDDQARKQRIAISCDICIRFQCRQLSILEVLDLTYRSIRYGIDAMLVKAAKKFLPTWAADIVQTVHHFENEVNPTDDKAVEFFFSLGYWLWFAGENDEARKTCINLGYKLADTTMPALVTMLNEVAVAAEKEQLGVKGELPQAREVRTHEPREGPKKYTVYSSRSHRNPFAGDRSKDGGGAK